MCSLEKPREIYSQRLGVVLVRRPMPSPRRHHARRRRLARLAHLHGLRRDAVGVGRVSRITEGAVKILIVFWTLMLLILVLDVRQIASDLRHLRNDP